MAARWKWGPIRSLLALAPVLIGVPWMSVKQHYSLHPFFLPFSCRLNFVLSIA